MAAYFAVERVLKGRITLTGVAEGDAHGRLTAQLHAMTLAEAMTPIPSEMRRIDSIGRGFRVKETFTTLTDKSSGVKV